MHLYVVVYQYSLYMLDIRGVGVAVAGELWCFPVVGCLLPHGYMARSGFSVGNKHIGRLRYVLGWGVS